jgi:phage shock protein A
MLVATILLGIVVLGWQMQLASELQTEVASLEGQLDRTRAVVDAQRSHLGEIRGGVYALSDQLDGLRALVDGGPQEGSSDSSEPVPATSITP